MAGITLDSGALIALERADRRIWVLLKEAASRKLPRTISAAVIAEVWRGGARSARLAQLLGACTVEPVSEALARAAGEALAAVKRGDTVDAIVMASAARRGDTVITSDPDDLGRLQACFPSVRILPL